MFPHKLTDALLNTDNLLTAGNCQRGVGKAELFR
jgi:hypothetical protein